MARDLIGEQTAQLGQCNRRYNYSGMARLKQATKQLWRIRRTDSGCEHLLHHWTRAVAARLRRAADRSSIDAAQSKAFKRGEDTAIEICENNVERHETAFDHFLHSADASDPARQRSRDKHALYGHRHKRSYGSRLDA